MDGSLGAHHVRVKGHGSERFCSRMYQWRRALARSVLCALVTVWMYACLCVCVFVHARMCMHMWVQKPQDGPGSTLGVIHLFILRQDLSLVWSSVSRLGCQQALPSAVTRPARLHLAFKFYFYMYVGFICIYVYAPYMCPVPGKVNRWYSVSWNWNYSL